MVNGLANRSTVIIPDAQNTRGDPADCRTAKETLSAHAYSMLVALALHARYVAAVHG